mmetsp:Transcript_40285/g.78930  ORF Transcript_40285/g.78930 Transcript_40285/m.78930 type:complete len:193 (+) Transcript_40285:457-1035(+)
MDQITLYGAPRLRLPHHRSIPRTVRARVPPPPTCNGVINQADSISGLILLFYLFEAIVRLFAFRWALVNGSRRLDTLDFAVVAVSVVVYCLAAWGSMAQLRMQQVVTLARVLRLFHLIKIIRRVVQAILEDREAQAGRVYTGMVPRSSSAHDFSPISAVIKDSSRRDSSTMNESSFSSKRYSAGKISISVDS